MTRPLPTWATEALHALGWMAGLREAGECLAAYQRFHGLDATGQLDEDTREHLTMPRFCALPDVMPVGATLAKWPQSKLTWAITAALPGVSAAEQKDAYAEAWSYWMAVCGIEAEYTANARTAQVLMGARRIDGPMGVLAESELANGTMAAKSQWYDTGEPWVIDAAPPSGRIDLVRVACHEIGHVLGLPHIGAGNLLAPIYSPTVRRPQAGDVAEVVARYGPPKAIPVGPTQPPGGNGPRQTQTILVFSDGSIKVQ